jgi:hypothetical protein
MRVGPLMSEDLVLGRATGCDRPRAVVERGIAPRLVGSNAPPSAGRVRKTPTEYCSCCPEWFSHVVRSRPTLTARTPRSAASQWVFWTAPNTIPPRIPDARV